MYADDTTIIFTQSNTHLQNINTETDKTQKSQIIDKSL